jgi:hypothetical protein
MLYHNGNEGGPAILISYVLRKGAGVEEAWLTFLLAPRIARLRSRP